MSTKSIDEYISLIKMPKIDSAKRVEGIVCQSAIEKLNTHFMFSGMSNALRECAKVSEHHSAQAGNIGVSANSNADKCFNEQMTGNGGPTDSDITKIIQDLADAVSRSAHTLNPVGNFANVCYAIMKVGEEYGLNWDFKPLKSTLEESFTRRPKA